VGFARPRLLKVLVLPLLIAALFLVLLSLFGALLWPARSEVERRCRIALVDALTGEGAGR
jgi:hypothetical protein